jgi:ankyrin repeat protein
MEHVDFSLTWFETSDCSEEDKLEHTPMIGRKVAELWEEALVEKDEQQILHLLNSHPDLCRRKDSKGQMVIHLAAKNGHLKLIEVLIKSWHVDVESKDYAGLTPLCHSIKHGNFAAAKQLIELFGADVNVRTHHSRTLLHFASVLESPDILQYLVQLNILDLNAIDNDGNTALHWAISSHRTGAVFLLTKLNAHVDTKNHQGNTLFMEAARNCKNTILIPYLMDRYPGVIDINCINKNGHNALYIAVEQNNFEAATLFIRAGSCLFPNILMTVLQKFTDTYVSRSVGFRKKQKTHQELLELLVAHGADVNRMTAIRHSYYGENPLFLCAVRGKFEYFKILTKSGNADANITCGKRNVTQIAVGCGHLNIVKLCYWKAQANDCDYTLPFYTLETLEHQTSKVDMLAYVRRHKTRKLIISMVAPLFVNRTSPESAEKIVTNILPIELYRCLFVMLEGSDVLLRRG